MTPQFIHDCDVCIFIARIERGEGVWKQPGWHRLEERTITWPAGDLWLCPDGGVIVRTGFDGPDYHSMGDAYYAALPEHWQPMARSIWRHYAKPDDFDYERMRERRRERRALRRLTRKGMSKLDALFTLHPIPSLPDYDDED